MAGRPSARSTVQRARTLDVYGLIKSGVIQRGKDCRCTMTWTDPYSGAETARVLVEAMLSDPDNQHLRLVHRHDGETIADYIVDLVGAPQPFGGERLYFTCPMSGDRVARLHMPPGARRFAGREAWGLAYFSQRASPRGRAIHRMHKLRQALGGEANPMKPIARPLGMHRKTFAARMADVEHAEARAFGFAVPAVLALQRRVERLRAGAG